MLQLLLTLPIIVILLLLFMGQMKSSNNSLKAIDKLLDNGKIETNKTANLQNVKQKYQKAIDDYAKASEKALAEVENIRQGNK